MNICDQAKSCSHAGKCSHSTPHRASDGCPFWCGHNTPGGHCVPIKNKKTILEKYIEKCAANLTEIAVLRRLLTECANEIESYVKAEYGWPNVHPAQQSKFDAGMSLVNEAREAAKGGK